MSEVFSIETERLLLLPLPAPLLSLWVNDMPALEKELNCRYDAEPMEGFFREIVKGQLEATEKATEEYMWRSFWLILRKEDWVVVGSADFKAPPDENGEVEIGYGLGKSYEHQGYMRETVAAMCRWALEQKDVRRVIAETDLDGVASQRVLTACGFKEYSRGETSWWRTE